MMNSNGDYYAPESILKHRETRLHGGKRVVHYYLKWLGYSNEHNSWLEPDALHLCVPLLEGYW